MSDYRPTDQSSSPFRKTLRLTFQSSGRAVRLVSQERLDMICPPSVGERPEAGQHSGFWVELRNDRDEPTFFRVLHNPIRSSVEVHSPDGKIRREFGPPEDSTFEVLVPNDPQAKTLVLMGEYQDPRDAKARKGKAPAPSGAQEMARFDLYEESGTPKDPEGVV